MCLHCEYSQRIAKLVLLSIVCCVAFAEQSQKQGLVELLDRPLTIEDIVLDTFVRVDERNTACLSQKIQYTKVISRDDGTYRAPHSRIFMDGKRCGKLGENATENDLWGDEHMQIMPLSYLNETVTARAKDTMAAYTELHDNKVLHHFAAGLFDFLENLAEAGGERVQVFVGFERFTERSCGDITIPLKSFMFFGRTTVAPFRLENLVPEITNDDVLLVRDNDPFHIAIVESGGENDTTCLSSIEIKAALNSSTDTKPALNFRKCFPASAVVRLENGESVTMDHVKIGDRILDARGQPSDVYMFSHRDSSSELHDFVQLQTSANLVLTLSAGHYVHTPNGLASAESLRPGSVIQAANGRETTVESRSYVRERGLYNPHTLKGDLLVNGIAVSSYTTAVSPKVAHALLAPVRGAFIASRYSARARQILGSLFNGGARDAIALLVPEGSDSVVF